MAKFSKRLEKLDPTILAKLANINDIFILFPRFRAILAEIEEVMVFSKTTAEPMCLQLTGKPGVGKSSIIATFCHASPPSDPAEGYTQPILAASIPSPSTVKRVVEEMLTGLGAPRPSRGNKNDSAARLYTLIQECGVELIILDEFQHLILSPTHHALRVVSNWIKAMINTTGKPVVLCGTPESRDILRSNTQLASRFRHRIDMHPFSLTVNPGEYVAFLGEFDRALNESIASDLLQADLPQRLMLASRGHVRELTALIREAARNTLLDDRDELDVASLSSQFELRADRDEWQFNPFEVSSREVSKRLGALV